MKNPGCWICKHYEQKSHVETSNVLNVSGELAKYRVWDKHRCKLHQEDKYPNHCDFEENKVLRAELDKRFPDLALIRKRVREGQKELLEL